LPNFDLNEHHMTELAARAGSVSVSGAPLPGSGTILRLQATVMSHRGFAAAATSLVSDLATLLRCERVSIGFVERGYAKVLAVSHGTQIEPRRDLFVRIAAAMDEAIEQGLTVVVPHADGVVPIISRANSELREPGAGAVCTVPLVSFGQAAGALALERAGEPFSASEVALCEDIACLVGPVLELKREAERSAAERILETLRRAAAGLFEPGQRGTKAVVFVAALALLGATLMPVPYRLGAPARLEGSMQRALVAPTEGFLQEVHVRPGDRVREGQVLVALSGQDLEVELRKRQSELTQHENAYQAALGRADRTLLVINQAKAAEAQAQLALVENQIARAHVRAPFDGVVIQGDLTQSVGSPVQRGDVLLTLAPNDQFRLIVEVDERDIATVRAGQAGVLALAAMPQEKLNFVVGRIMPVAIAGEGRNYFEVEAVLEAPGVPLRPGLRGVAKVEVGRHSLAWAATHRLFDWLRLNLWALGI